MATINHIAIERLNARRGAAFVPSAKALDAMAEKVITGGWKRTATCPVCFVRTSTNGSCNC